MAYASFRAIVPAGGAGTRLWPVSRRSSPKFLHDFTASGQSLLQGTVDRLSALVDEVLVVTGDIHAGVVQEQVPACGVVTEPSPKDSMPAIALGAAILRRRYPREDLVVGSFAADHVVRDSGAFAAALAVASDLAREGEIVTIGVTPTHPATAYGYIRPGAELVDRGRASGRAGERGAYRVVEFEEKPDADTASTYLSRGYLWNAGMYVARADVLRDRLAQFHPELSGAIDEIAAAWDTPARRDTLERIWPAITPISIDHAIAEPSAPLGQVAVVPADLGWSDVGDWDAIGAIHSSGEADAVTVLGDEANVLALDSPGAVVAAGKQVVVVGLEGAVVVETADAILVTTRAHAQQVKGALELLEEARADLL